MPTAAQKTEQQATLANVRAIFNANAAAMNQTRDVLKATQAHFQSDQLSATVLAFNEIVDSLNDVGPKLLAQISATDALTPSDDTTTKPAQTFVRFAPDMSSDAAIQAVFAHAAVFFGTLPTVNQPSKWIDGMLEVPIIPGLNAGDGIGGTGCSWHWFMPQTPNVPPDELWCEYDFYIDPDVLLGFNEEGCKLPGLGGAWEQDGQWNQSGLGGNGWFSARLWHRRPAANGDMEFCGYVYSARSMEAGNPFGEVIPTGKMLRPATKYKLGQHIKLNSRASDGTWLSDGVYEMLLDGVVVFSDAAFKMRADVRAVFQDFFVNIFHGGSKPPTAPIHYRIGGIVVDNKPLTTASNSTTGSSSTTGGVILQGAVPAWRKNLPLNQWSDIPLAWLPEWPGTFDGDYSGLAHDRVNGVIWKAAGTGHAVSDDNKVYRLDVMRDALSWTIARESDGVSSGGRIRGPDGQPISHIGYWPTGRPVGCHLYYAEVVAHIGGKPVVVRVFNAAGDFMSDAPPRTDAFHPERNDWDLNGQGWDAPLTEYVESCVAIDARTNRVYTANQNTQWAVLDCNTGKWTRLPDQSYGPGWSGSVIAPNWNEHVFTIDNGQVIGRNLDSGAFTVRGQAARARCMLIQERHSTIYMVGYDSKLYRLNMLTGATDTLDAVPQPVTIYNRMEDYPALGGIVHIPQFGQPLRFFATE